MTEDQYKVTYTFHVEHENINLSEYPKHTINTLSFDGTDVTLDVVISQVETFLKAAGYYFDRLEIVNDSYLK